MDSQAYFQQHEYLYLTNLLLKQVDEENCIMHFMPMVVHDNLACLILVDDICGVFSPWNNFIEIKESYRITKEEFIKLVAVDETDTVDLEEWTFLSWSENISIADKENNTLIKPSVYNYA